MEETSDISCVRHTVNFRRGAESPSGGLDGIRKEKEACIFEWYSLAALIFLQRVPTRASPTPPAMQKTRINSARVKLYRSQEFMARATSLTLSRHLFHS